MCVFCASGYHRDLHSFPTRRSSDLSRRHRTAARPRRRGRFHLAPAGEKDLDAARADADQPLLRGLDPHAVLLRSEEHTSELQSQSNLVCRLLLEKKNKNKETHLPST